MAKSFKFKSDEEVVGKATEIFEKLGLTLDSAVNIFLKKSILKNGLPFQLVLEEDDSAENNAVENITVTNAVTNTESEKPVEEPVEKPEEEKSSVSEEIAERVRQNEALTLQARIEEGVETNYIMASPAQPTAVHIEEEVPTVSAIVNEQGKVAAAVPAPAQKSSPEAEEKAHEEDEDETAPDTMFSSWDDEPEVGCGC